MSTDRTSTLALDALTPLHWLGIVLAAISGVLHLWLGVQFLDAGPMGLSFLVAGVGFLLGIAAVLVAFRPKLTYLLGIPFTGGQIVLWYVFNFAGGEKAFPAEVGAIGAVDKLAQVALIVVLVVLYRRAG
jgi:hypothetical protein